jgi:DNA invertase Pin-like site-specific DNA recombinase
LTSHTDADRRWCTEAERIAGQDTEDTTAMTPTAGSTSAAYLRRSSVSGDNPGDASREAQEAAVRRLCGEDVALYVDWGISGRTADKRPDYMRLKEDIVAGRIASVCAYSLSRLGRNARELLAFIELAQAHGVPVRTAVESIDTSTAMGRAMLTVMAAFAQLELEQGMERSAAAREARRERHQAAGMPVPPSRSLYGYVHITEDGLTRVERDTTPIWEGHDRIDTVLDAYREAGNVLAAAGLLNQRGVPSPDGSVWDPETKRGGWGHSTLRRIIEASEAPPSRLLAATRSRPTAGRIYPASGSSSNDSFNAQNSD